MIEVKHYTDVHKQPNVQEYLSRAMILDMEIRGKMEQIERLHSWVTRCTQKISGMPHGGATSDWSDTVARILDLEEALKADIGRLTDMKQEIKSAIESVKNLEYRHLLESRYLCGWSWQKISDDMHCSRSTIWRMHQKALAEVKVETP